MHPFLQRCQTQPIHAAMWLAGGGSVAALALAYLSQYGFGLHPCHLCLWQRVPYALAAVLAAALLWRAHSHAVAGNWLLLLVLVMVGEAGLAGYHAGMEWGFWQGATGCSGNLTSGLTPDELLKRIMEAPAVSCSEAALRVLGLSMAGWNALYALALAGGIGYLWRRSKTA